MPDLEKIKEEVWQMLQASLKSELGELWDANKDELQKWAILVAKLQWQALTKKTENGDLALAYAQNGILCLKARLQFKLESSAWRIVEKVLGTALHMAMITLKNSLI